MHKRQLIVKVSSLEETLDRCADVWKRSMQGEKFETPIQILSFENTALMMKMLSPKRLELLQGLHALGKVSIRKLTQYLDRDYSNVHHDVKALCKAGLILEDKKTGKYYVPWDSI